MAEFFAAPDEEAMQGRASDLDTSMGESLSAQAGEGFGSGTRTALRALQYEHLKGNFITSDAMLSDPDYYDRLRQSFADMPRVPIDQARARVKDEGLEGELTLPNQPDIRQPVLDLMIDHAHERQKYNAAVERGPHGFFPGSLGFATSIGAGMLDPVNYAAFMVPVVSEARGAALLERAGESLFARAGARALVGGAQGAVGSAALQPADWWLHTLDGQDYTMATALENIVQGAVMGGAMHATGVPGALFGARDNVLGDLLARARGEPLPGSPADLVERSLIAGASRDAAALEARAPLEDVPGITTARTAPPSPRPEGARGEAAGGEPAQSDRDHADAAALVRGLLASQEGANRDEVLDAENGLPLATILAELERARREGGAGVSPSVTAYDPAQVDALVREIQTKEGIPPGPTPAEIFADLPPAARADAIRAAAADVITDQPGRAGEMVAIAAQQDPRIAESIDAAETQQRRAAAGQGAVYDDVYMQLRAAGILSDMGQDEAAANAAIVAARYGARAARLGLPDAFALYRREGLSIRGQGAYEPPAGVRAFEQGRDNGTSDLFAAREADGQTTLPGAERIGEGELAQRRAAAPLRPKVAQRPADEGLFGDQAAQKTLFQGPAPPVPPFYSAVERAVRLSRTEKASPEQWLATIRNTAGVKAEELEWLGLAHWLEEQKGPVTRAQIADYVRANAIEVREVEKFDKAAIAAMPIEDIKAYNATHTSPPNTKYDPYQLPGGENYRELLLTLPERDTVTTERVPVPGGWGDVDGGDIGIERHGDTGSDYRASHWDEPNVLAHVRFSDRVVGGKHTLFLEEVQSDWHQAGRRLGYRDTEAQMQRRDAVERIAREKLGNLDPGSVSLRDVDRWRRRGVLDDADVKAFEEWHAGLTQRGVPDAPFKTTWPELVLKRMIRYAAEHGYEQVAWTPGEAQAARYELSKQISRLYFTRHGDGTYSLAGDHADPNAPPVHLGTEIPEQDLARHVGKEVADRIVQRASKRSGRVEGSLEGLELKLGGEGMTAFYDKMLPAAANKLVKKYGARVETLKPDQGARSRAAINKDMDDVLEELERREPHAESSFELWQRNPDLHARNRALQDEYNGAMAREDGQSLDGSHVLPITPALREAAVGEGFPLFQGGEAGPRGRIMLGENRAIVDLFKTADASTFMHEMGHKWLDELARDAQREGVPQALKDDLGTILRWLGVTKAEDIGVAEHERFARGFEQYLARGEAPSSRLAEAFAKFKQWMAAIYRAIAGGDSPISAEVRGVFDRMLATDEEIAAHRGVVEQASPLTPTLSPQARGEGEKAQAQGEELQPAVHVARGKRFGPAARDPATWSLFEFLAHRGGLKPNGELATIFGGKNPQVFGFGRLLRPNGMSLDRALEAALGAGYFIDEGMLRGRESEIGHNDLLEALDRQARADKVYRIGHEPARAVDRDEELHYVNNAIDHAFTENGDDPARLTPQMRARVIEIMTREGVRDPLDAYERAVLEEDRNAVDQGQTPAADFRVPGFDVPDDAEPAPGAGRPGAGEPAGSRGAPRAARPNDRASAADPAAWQRLRDVRDPDAAGDLAASRAAEREPEPASVDVGKTVSAAEAEAAKAEALLNDLELTEEERRRVDDSLNALAADRNAQEQILRDGAACLMAAAVGAA